MAARKRVLGPAEVEVHLYAAQRGLDEALRRLDSLFAFDDMSGRTLLEDHERINLQDDHLRLTRAHEYIRSVRRDRKKEHG